MHDEKFIAEASGIAWCVETWRASWQEKLGDSKLIAGFQDMPKSGRGFNLASQKNYPKLSLIDFNCVRRYMMTSNFKLFGIFEEFLHLKVVSSNDDENWRKISSSFEYLHEHKINKFSGHLKLCFEHIANLPESFSKNWRKKNFQSYSGLRNLRRM